MKRSVICAIRSLVLLLGPIAALAGVLVIVGMIDRQPAHAFETVVVSQALLVNATTGSAVVGRSASQQCRAGVVYVVWGAGTGAGVVTIESAYTSTYAGTWAPLTTVTWSAASKTDLFAITGVHGALRTRVSTTVTGGTVNTYFLCN